MSNPGPAQDSNMPDAQAHVQPSVSDNSATMAEQQDSSKPLSLGYSIEGLAKPGQFDDQPAFPGINLNENMELGFKNVFNAMVDHFEKAESEAAESLAHELISWARLPVLYRVYSHVILAHGPVDRLYHACKAIEQAQRGLQKYGDEQGVGTKLLSIAQSTLQQVNDEATAAINQDNKQGEEQVGSQHSSTEQHARIPVVEGAGDLTKRQESDEEQPTMSFVEQAERLLGRPIPRAVTNRKPALAPQGDDDEMLFDSLQPGMPINPVAQNEPVATSQPGGDAKVSFASQQQMSTAPGKSSYTRTTSSATNVTRTSSSTTAPSRTTSGTTEPPSRAASNTTNITDFASQGDGNDTTGPGQEGGDDGTGADEKKREKRDRSDSSEEADQPAKKKADK